MFSEKNPLSCFLGIQDNNWNAAYFFILLIYWQFCEHYNWAILICRFQNRPNSNILKSWSPVSFDWFLEITYMLKTSPFVLLPMVTLLFIAFFLVIFSKHSLPGALLQSSSTPCGSCVSEIFTFSINFLKRSPLRFEIFTF